MGITLELSVQMANPLAFLKNGERRMSYAIANAINTTARAIQDAERERAHHAFTVRKAPFLDRQVAIISPFASASAHRFEARIAVGQKPRLLLGLFETGGPRPAFKGKNVAVPITGGPARPTFGQNVPADYTFQGLRIIKSIAGQGKSKRGRRNVDFAAHITAGGKLQFKGQHRTFILTETNKAPLGGVFQRIGPSRDDIRLIYSFKHAPELHAQLKFVETGQRIAHERFLPALRHEVSEAFERGLRSA